GLLCLATRVAGVEGVGVDCDPALVRLAIGNAAQNGMPGLRFAVADVMAEALPHGAGDQGRCGFGGFGRFHHAFANPPYHPDSGAASPDPGRRRAKQAEPGLIGAWTTALAGCLHPRGTLTLILPPAALPEVLAAMQAANCAARAMLPLWPRLGRPARLLLVQGVRAGRSPFRVLPGLVLHEADGFTPAADAVLRDAAALPMA
ncbi:MAG: SAM-dependent methyltransferase, partial [Rhodospirillales bacterium]|nr:SAM-dependent methyltransferase [Rhodospirillales bacterium]